MTLTERPEKKLKALPVSPGIAIGRVCRFGGGTSRYEDPGESPILPEDAESELEHFRQALDDTRRELVELQEQLKSRLETAEADIFDAHLLILTDAKLISEVENGVRTRFLNAAHIFYTVIERYVGVFSQMQDEYLRERAIDIRDVAFRVLGHLNVHKHTILQPDDRRILVAADLTPSETAQLDPAKVLGFVLENGSATSHTAILARSMRLPALVGVGHGALEALTDCDRLIIDGFSGRLILNPEPRTEEAYRVRAEEAGRLLTSLQRDAELDVETIDGFRVELALNLESADALPEVKKVGATGIGLFRTEFLYIGSATPPDEETQFEIYKSLLVAMEDHPVVIRTLDAGGDKLPGSLHLATEMNPFLGLRGIRLCLRERRDLFRCQLRALLRAGVFGNLKVMLPMISVVEEIYEVKALIAELLRELNTEGVYCVSRLSLGVMIETPAAVLQVERIAQHVDFLSIGTNDLLQYTMAADRGNERVAYLQQMGHPLFLGMIDRCARAAHKNRIWCGVCGQMAADPFLTPLLLGMGIHELSMDPSSIALVRRVVRGLRMHEAVAAVAEALECENETAVMEVARRRIRVAAPEIENLLAQQGS